MLATAKKTLTPLESKLRLPAARTVVQAKLTERRVFGGGAEGVYKWAAKVAKFNNPLQHALLRNYMGLSKQRRDTYELSPSEIRDLSMKISLNDSPEFKKALEANTTSNAENAWAMHVVIPGMAMLKSTIGRFGADAVLNVKSHLSLEGNAAVREYDAKGTFTVSDDYNFDTDEKEVARALDDLVAGKTDRLYEVNRTGTGRTLEGELKTFVMSMVPGKPFTVTIPAIPLQQKHNDAVATLTLPEEANK